MARTRLDGTIAMKRLIPFLLALALIFSLAGSVEARPFLDLSSGLIAYWHMDETSGTRVDAVGNNDLSETGPVGYAAGKFGNAASFSGGTEQLSQVDDTALSGHDGFTIAFWLYPEALPDEGTSPIVAAISNEGGYPIEWTLFDVEGYFDFEVDSGSNPGDLITDAPLALDGWYYVLAWYDPINEMMGLAINDVEVEQPWTEGVQDLTGVPLYFNGDDGGIGFTGRVDEAAYWNRPLASDERTSLYNDGQGQLIPVDHSSGGSSINLDLSFTPFQSAVSNWFTNLWPILAFVFAIAIIQVIIIVASLSFLNALRGRRRS